MYISETMKDVVLLGTALLMLTVFSVWHPTGDIISYPSYWVDEAVSVEKAQSFLTYGVLDVPVAPGVVSGKPYATAAAGPLLTLPLAGFFFLFGVGVMQVRLYMLVWLFLLTGVSYFFVRKIGGRRAAFFSVLLLATFSPLYANGKTATGDVPGFVALLLALYYLYVRKWYLLSGVLLGIATTTKPSLYLLLFVLSVAEILLSESQSRLRHVCAIAGGWIAVCMPWLVSLPARPLTRETWKEVYLFFTNPFPADAVRAVDVLFAGDASVLTHTTVLYYVAFAVVTLLAVWYTRREDGVYTRLLRFAVLYALAAGMLYVRSPGWLRYLLAGQLLLFLMFPVACDVLFRQRSWRYNLPSQALSLFLGMLIVGQILHFFFFSWRTASWGVTEKAASLIVLAGADKTVGVIDDPSVASLLPAKQVYQVMRISGNTVLGISPLAYAPEKLPDYVFIPYSRFSNDTERDFVEPYTVVLQTQYRNITPPGERYAIYQKMP